MKNPFLTESENKRLAHLWFEEDEAKRNEPKATVTATYFRGDSWKPDGITDNRREWKNKEFKRLFPNSLFEDYRRFLSSVAEATSLIVIHRFNLREYKEEYLEKNRMNSSEITGGHGN